jgi:hypothetical protein
LADIIVYNARSTVKVTVLRAFPLAKPTVPGCTAATSVAKS